ncbi:hypothetical protein SAMN05421821_103256 [Mucilaginibacter lappiensis]|uniref:Uncharacterized protein n=1 Tax=Mucilaginibacter lappiensis TaxID=354630 RepID=A0A1N6V349_9SPHI|nr:hypothetical protein [Mucilaginibacter lappiensis]MBB6127385.1 hypothetical protein [Mucilaginibacter lappiensis]SIQ72208.1 hypothetical protein SAMN05421821_103256 [Mucilaginibacter lappiensis]
MLSSVEAWWAGLCALPFDGTQGDIPIFETLFTRLQPPTSLSSLS